ncbi:MAG TPA: ACP phosphodiesterase [Cyclobacteriaceae bacterium]|nr:ACP phosphodiesterase [Cyclobacteriaceae bacterium]
MNFLAHLYLSGDHPDIKVGNFIGDFVKGRNLGDTYGVGIALGVEMHRGIDVFTDRHPVMKMSKDRLRLKYRHYSGVITDIFYDHFLATNWKSYSNMPLETYAANAYQLIIDREALMPERVKQMLPYMMRGNWLVNYGKIEGISQALAGMTRRATFDSKMDESIEDLKNYYDEFKKEFDVFFPELKNWADEWLLKNLPA